MELLRAMRNKYKSLWAASETPIAYAWHGRIAELPRLTIEELREASASFCEDTATAHDGIYVRAYRHLCDQGLEALATTPATVEVAGFWPTAASLTTVTLIDKRAGGHRGIANLCSSYRVWSKARKP